MQLFNSLNTAIFNSFIQSILFCKGCRWMGYSHALTSFFRKYRGKTWYILCLCPRPLLSLQFLLPYSCSPIVDKSTHGFLLNFTSFSRKCRGRIWYILCLCPCPLMPLPFLIPYSCSPITDRSTHGFWTSLPFLSLTHLITQAYVEYASQVRDVKCAKKRWSRKLAALAMPEHVQHCYHSLRFNNNGFSGCLIPDKRGWCDTVILTTNYYQQSRGYPYRRYHGYVAPPTISQPKSITKGTTSPVPSTPPSYSFGRRRSVVGT